jgi:hypothetical protein
VKNPRISNSLAIAALLIATSSAFANEPKVNNKHAGAVPAKSVKVVNQKSGAKANAESRKSASTAVAKLKPPKRYHGKNPLKIN